MASHGAIAATATATVAEGSSTAGSIVGFNGSPPTQQDSIDLRWGSSALDTESSDEEGNIVLMEAGLVRALIFLPSSHNQRKGHKPPRVLPVGLAGPVQADLNRGTTARTHR